MNTSISIHGVDRIKVSAASCPSEAGLMCWWQTLKFFDRQGGELGELVAFLERPEAAIPVGDQPPYWGLDLRQPLGLVDGESPF